MMSLASFASAPALEAWLAFRREAGVLEDCADEPRDWFALAKAEREATERAPPAPPRAKPKGSRRPRQAPQGANVADRRADWPGELSEFRAYWLSDPSLEVPGAGARIAGAGERDAAFAVVVAQPGAGDGETLFDDDRQPDGAFLKAFAAAAGLTDGDVALVAALPGHLPLADWGELRGLGWGELLAHQLRLLAPRRAVVFGQDASSLLNHAPSQPARPLDPIAFEAEGPVAAAAASLPSLTARAKERARLWRAWIEWTQ